jgi:uncharacterized protein (TIGR03000 family)
MVRRPSLLFGSATLSTALFMAAADAHGPGGGHGGYHYGGFYQPYNGHAFYGPYRPGLYAPYGFYRPYYGYGLYGPGLAAAGFGLGFGLGYGLGGYGLYRPYPYYGGTTIVAPTVVVAPPASGTGGPPVGAAGGTGAPPAGETQPPPDNAAHLQLALPENTEVLFDGGKTTQTGPVREFVSPALPPGKLFDYTIVVRYTDANGKAVTDRRVIHVRANDWFRIDFTRPAPPEPLPAP